MHKFNRSLLIALDIVFLVITGWAMALASGAALPNYVALWFERRLALASTTTGWWGPYFATTWIALGLFILGAILLGFELGKRDRQPRAVLVQGDTMGRTTIGEDEIRTIVRQEAASVPGVMEIEPRITDGKSGIRVLNRIAVAPNTDLVEVSRLLRDRIRTAVEHCLGRPVSEVTVDAHLGHLRHSH